ncbi:MAG: PP2C family protein-serine/threonine phosphatase [Nocardioides sp.]
MSQQNRSGPSVRQVATSALRRSTPPESRRLWLLVLLSIAMAVLLWFAPQDTPLTLLVLPMLLGSLNLGPRHLPWFVVFLLVLVVGLLSNLPDMTLRVIGGVGVLFAAGFIILLTSFRRTRLGVAGAQGEMMLVDLRDRIQSQSLIPALPSGFRAESALRSAGGTPFAGDFVVTMRPPETDRFEVVVVDVSGKGESAGTRALLLAGALGGLIGALAPEEFLPAANEFLLRQDWDEGFATAVHLSLDLGSGRYELRSAGHPPAAHRAAGSGRWDLRSDHGPALGLLDGAEFPFVVGELKPGDAMMMYTDGMVETRDKDIELGIDRMLGKADLLLRGEFEGGAERLIGSLGSRNDDRALVLVFRR